MKSSRMFLATALAAALASCASQKNNYDTPEAYGQSNTVQAQAANTIPGPPVNPTYDTPPAYEDGGTIPPVADDPGALKQTTPDNPATASHVATVHTVVKGDTLGKIARQYKVPMASIKKANGMTNDTVILGRKMRIPAN